MGIDHGDAREKGERKSDGFVSRIIGDLIPRSGNGGIGQVVELPGDFVNIILNEPLGTTAGMSIISFIAHVTQITA